MKVQEVMTSNPITVAINATVTAAAAAMARNDVGALPVVENGNVRGMITDRDITIRVVAKGLDPSRTRVGDAMTGEVYSCYEDQDIGEVAKEMEDKKIRRVIVFDRMNKLAGIMSLGDIIEHGAKTTATEILEMVSVPVHSFSQQKQRR
jgi:CBS domain-containing protein